MVGTIEKNDINISNLDEKFQTDEIINKIYLTLNYPSKRVPIRIIKRVNEKRAPKLSSWAYYKDNFIVYTKYTKDDKRHVISIKDNHNIEMKGGRESDNILLGIHAAGQMRTRSISEDEIINCIKYGLKAKDEKIRKNIEYKNSYYFLGDLCVIATKHKDRIEVGTVYRLSDINDSGFMSKIENMLMKLSQEKHSNLKILDKTEQESMMNSEAGKLVQMILDDKASLMNPMLGEFCGNFYKNYIEKITVFDSSKDDAEYFVTDPHKNYTCFINFETDKNTISEKQKEILKDAGLDPEKASENIYNEKITYVNNRAVMAFDMRKFCANQHTWSLHRDKKMINLTVETK